MLRPYLEMEIVAINQIHPSLYYLNLQEEFAPLSGIFGGRCVETSQ
jgi:hypothetical protein